MRIEIDQVGHGQRADKYLASHFSVSRARAQALLEAATLNGAPLKSSHALRAGDVLELPEVASAAQAAPPLVEAPVYEASEVEMPPVVFEDEHLLIINKPRGLTVHAGAGETGATLVDVLRAHGVTLSNVGPPERGGIVHRLDKDTTGVMAVCKTDAAHWALAAAFEARTVKKTYLALVSGVPRSPGRVEAPIARHPVSRQKMVVAPHGKVAITQYEVLERWPKFALCEIDLLTGRTHQIRVHFAYLGNPVAGDAVYGGVKRALDGAPDDEVRAALESLGGQALLAHKLAFAHPVTDEPMSFEAPLPPDFEHALEALRAFAAREKAAEISPSQKRPISSVQPSHDDR
jgi:23S rRNA pseudouridine1911/1915/1917 synthase